MTLEPQAQLAYQYLDFDQARDIFSSVDIEAADVLTGRLGVRLAGEFGAGLNMWRPYSRPTSGTIGEEPTAPSTPA